MSTQQPDHEILRGIETLLVDYVVVRDSDTFAIAYTPDSRDSAAWIALVLHERGFSASTVAMRPLSDDLFSERLQQALPPPDQLSGRLVVLTLERDTMSHFTVFAGVMQHYGAERCMVVRMISATPDLFTKAFNLTPSDLSALNASLLHRFYAAKRLRVKTNGGTDLQIEIDSEQFQWISNRGMWRPGGFTILPPGEIATYPVRVNGILVADGAFNANVLTSLNANLAGNPVHVEIENSRALNHSCANADLQHLFQMFFDSPHGRRVGELGFGTNHGIDAFVAANSHINERRCGVHLGFGQHNQSLKRVPYEADVHLDLITAGATVWVDDDTEPIDLSAVQPSAEPHPTDVLDEDITGDCCGLGYGQLHELCVVDS